MNISKYTLKGLTAIFTLLLLVTVLPMTAFAEELPTTTATITVEKRLTGDTPTGVDPFTFVLTPDNASYPMPEGIDGNVITIQGADTASFGAITYSEPNTYTYTLKENVGLAEKCIYDKTVYKVTVYVTTDDAGNLTATTWVTRNGSAGKSESAVFTNRYGDPIPPDPNHPETGDTANLALWIALAAGSAVALLLLLIVSKRKKGDNQQS